MEARAQARYVRVTPMKARRVVDLIRGLPAADPRVTSYKGIPFAAPPTGGNRWRAPQPCPPWEGVLNAYDFGPITPQAVTGKHKENIYSREWAVDDDPLMDEDCLYLNVWAPADGKTGLPVFVWYFGGGLQVGATSEMEFDGERIASRGAVVVTVNYRLNVFGFLAHPELTAENPESPTNFGFLDQQFATQWVKRNAAAFGGDPDNVTIVGESAGGSSVCFQLASPMAAGLFHRAIIQSSGCGGMATESAAPRFAADEDVLRHGQVRHQVQFLVNDADAQVLRRAWVGDVHFLAPVIDAARVLAVDAGENLHQGGFACAVLTDQGMHLAGTQFEVRLIQRMNARKALVNPFHHHEGFTHASSSLP